MSFVQVGGVSINLDRVDRIQDLSTKDSSGQTVSGPVRVYFGPRDWIDLTDGADVLRTWLSSNAQSLPGG